MRAGTSDGGAASASAAHAAVETLRRVPRQLVQALVVGEAHNPLDGPIREVPADRTTSTGIGHVKAVAALSTACRCARMALCFAQSLAAIS